MALQSAEPASNVMQGRVDFGVHSYEPAEKASNVMLERVDVTIFGIQSAIAKKSSNKTAPMLFTCEELLTHSWV